MKLTTLFLLLFLLSACASASGDVDLPVDYFVCNQAYNDCILSARFKDMYFCQNHNEISGMLCDRESQPGVITCTAYDSPFATGLCSYREDQTE